MAEINTLWILIGVIIETSWNCGCEVLFHAEIYTFHKITVNKTHRQVGLCWMNV